MKQELTDRQSDVLEFIKEWIRDIGYPPTNRDIMNAFELGSTNAVSCHLKAIEKKGYIERTKNVARGIRVLE